MRVGACGRIEHAFGTVADAELIDYMGEETREEAAATAAEVSAALNISRGRASSQIHYVRVLRERLPAVAKVFATGVIDFRMVLTIIARTENVDDEVIAELDGTLARHVAKWMRFSVPKLRDRIDVWVAKFDPAGVRIPPKVDEDRFVAIEPDGPGMALIWGSIHATDAAAFEQRLDALAAGVCPDDPRTTRQRRADACGAMARQEARLECECGRPDCPLLTERKALANAVIHVLAERATIDGASDKPGYLRGFGILPTESVREVAKSAKLKPLTQPTGEAEPGYRPSAALSEFVRWRDLTCRFPGCDARVEACDIDHTAPYPFGPTHPTNTKLYCRAHHLLWRHGWREEERSSWTQQGRTANQGQARAERGARLKKEEVVPPLQ